MKKLIGYCGGMLLMLCLGSIISFAPRHKKQVFLRSNDYNEIASFIQNKSEQGYTYVDAISIPTAGIGGGQYGTTVYGPVIIIMER